MNGLDLRRNNLSALRVGAILVMCLMAAVFCTPRIAFAAEDPGYTCNSVDITATVSTDGSMRISETRTLTFTKDVNYLTWETTELPEGGTLSCNGVRVIYLDANNQAATVDLGTQSFSSEWRNAADGSTAIPSRCYSLDTVKHVIYVFFQAHAGETFTFNLDYTVTNVVQVYQDAAELTWDFVPWFRKEDSNNVNVTVVLPLPLGTEAQAGVNVWAWSHGPAGSTLDVTAGGTVAYHVDSIQAQDQYLQLVVDFPPSWVMNVNMKGKAYHKNELHLETVQESEAEWFDSAGRWVRLNYVKRCIWVSVCVAALLITLVAFAVAWGRSRKRASEDEIAQLAQDIAEHPAVGGRLLRHNQISSQDLVAEARSLCQRGILRLNGTTLVPTAAKDEAAGLDVATLDLLFLPAGQGASGVSVEEYPAFAARDPKAFAHGLQAWQGALTDHMEAAGAFVKADFTARRVLLGLAFVLVLAGIGLCATGSGVESLACYLVTAVLVGAVAVRIPHCSAAGAAWVRGLTGDGRQKKPACAAVNQEQGANGQPASQGNSEAADQNPWEILQNGIDAAWAVATDANGLSPILDDLGEDEDVAHPSLVRRLRRKFADTFGSSRKK